MEMQKKGEMISGLDRGRDGGKGKEGRVEGRI